MDPTTEAAPKPRTFLGIQALRGLAACLVVVSHATSSWWVAFGDPTRPAIWSNGASGVEIFFIISGFVMTISATGRKTPTAANFLERRLLRIGPLYWLATFVALVEKKLVHMPHMYGVTVTVTETSFAYVAASLLFLPYRNPSGLLPLVSVGWTLMFEMFFYVLFAAALWLKVKPIRFLTPVITAIAIAGCFRRDSWPSLMYYIDPIVLEFLAGVLLAYVVQRGLRMRGGAAAAMGVLGLGALFLIPESSHFGMRVVEWGIPALMLVGAMVMLEGEIGMRIPRWVLKIGDASYSLYLAHVFVVLVLVRVAARMHVWVSEVEFAVVCLVASVLVSLAVHAFVERPITVALSRWSHLRVSRSAIGVSETVTG